MGEAAFRRESATQYFKELVEGALAHQHVAARELTTFYLVHLLTGFLQRHPDCDDEPLALKLVEALESGGRQRRSTLKQIGDASLFVSGFFSDSLRDRLVDVDYYVSMGGYAYSALSHQERDTFSPVFAELADKFVAFVDVFCEVSERTACTSNTDLLRVYERYLRTGSRHSGQLLRERGVFPLAAVATTSTH